MGSRDRSGWWKLRLQAPGLTATRPNLSPEKIQLVVDSFPLPPLSHPPPPKMGPKEGVSLPSGKDSEQWPDSYFHWVLKVTEISDSGLFLVQRSICEGEKERRVLG